MKNRTYTALLGRGIDSNTANRLVKDGYTLESLKQKKYEDLIKLGIRIDEIKNIQDGHRPPIPKETVFKLLHESKRTCCICRDQNRTIVIHHLKKWSETRKHLEKDLVVLCLIHHDEAHTRKELSLNLSESQIRKHKERWISDVATMDAQAILGLKNGNEYSNWDFLNHKRIFELFLKRRPHFEDKYNIQNYLRKLNIINKLGVLTSIENWKIQSKPDYNLYDFGDGMGLYYYTSNVWEAVLKSLLIKDITGIIGLQALESILKVNDFISIQNAFYFKKLEQQRKLSKGKNQMRKGYYKKGKVIIEFIFDAFEATSNSAWGLHLTGHKVITPILKIKSIANIGSKLIISTSCLAIGSHFEKHPYRQELENKRNFFF